MRFTAMILAIMCVCAGGAGVYADDGIMPVYVLTQEYDFDFWVEPGEAVFSVFYSADSSLFDHAEWEMRLQKKGLIFWSDVDVTITQMWIYQSTKNQLLRQDIPDVSGKYRANYILRIVATDGRVDTVSGSREYNY